MRLARFWCGCALILPIGCARQRIRVPAATASTRPNRSYTDLQAGSTLHIILPLTKSGQLAPQITGGQAEGNTISLNAADLIGYTTTTYSVVGKNNDVRLSFVSAESVENGKATPLEAAPQLPFALPQKTAHVRLVFLVRVSAADHNMAIVAAKHAEELDPFTTRLMQDPTICTSQQRIFCSWVPSGIAVRPETGAAERSGAR